MEAMNMTLDEVITLASIVQAEAPTISSMRMVSSVFHNRMNNSMTFPKLESDPTRVYAEDVIAPNLSIKNEIMCNAYNTYIQNGLPPGAINNPGKDAITAVLRPDDTQYYFFCANVQTGEIFYAQDNAGHEENLAAIKLQQCDIQMNLLTLRNTTVIMKIKPEKFLKRQRVYCYFPKVVEETQSTLEVVMYLLIVL